jgi:hypothetical protein
MPGFGICLFPNYVPNKLVKYSCAASRKMEEQCIKTESLKVWLQYEVFTVRRLKLGERSKSKCQPFSESPLLAGLSGTGNSISHITSPTAEIHAASGEKMHVPRVEYQNSASCDALASPPDAVVWHWHGYKQVRCGLETGRLWRNV